MVNLGRAGCWARRGTYGELGVDLGEGVAGYAVGDLEVGIVLDCQDAGSCGGRGCCLGLAGVDGGWEGKGRDGEGEDEGGFEEHIGCWFVGNGDGVC